MLDEVVVPNALRNDRLLQFTNHVQLVVSRENEHPTLLLSHLFVPGVVSRDRHLLLVDEVVD